MFNKLISINKVLSPKSKEILQKMTEALEGSGLGLKGKSLANCSITEIYTSLSQAIRKTITPQWQKTNQAYRDAGAKQTFYFSMEFLMGRLSGNNIDNLGLNNEVAEIISYLKATNPALTNTDDVRNELERIEQDWGLGNGGLGRLAACFLDSGATLRLPLHGMGLWYDYGIFEQHIQNGYQTETPDEWSAGSMPWIIKDDSSKVTVKFGGNMSPEHGKMKIEGYDSVEMVPFRAPVPGFSKEGNPNINTLTLWRVNPRSSAVNFDSLNNGNYHDAYSRVIKS